MKPTPLRFNFVVLCLGVSLLILLAQTMQAQTCQISADMDAATRTAITNAGQRYFDMAAKDDVASLRQNSIPSLSSDFSGIEALLKERQPDLSGAQSTVKNTFLLDNQQSDPNGRDEFYCGVFNRNGQTTNSAAFYLSNLPPAKYAVVLLDGSSSKARTMFSEILQQIGNDWKLGGLYIKPAQIGGHDSDWFLNQSRQYKAKGQTHDAWFYCLEARSLIA